MNGDDTQRSCCLTIRLLDYSTTKSSDYQPALHRYPLWQMEEVTDEPCDSGKPE